MNQYYSNQLEFNIKLFYYSLIIKLSKILLNISLSCPLYDYFEQIFVLFNEQINIFWIVFCLFINNILWAWHVTEDSVICQFGKYFFHIHKNRNWWKDKVDIRVSDIQQIWNICMKEDNNNFFVYVTTQNHRDQFSCHPKLINNEHFHICRMGSNV